MPSPFPGMDPFIEADEWGDFHSRINSEYTVRLGAVLPTGLVARMERRVVIEDGGLDGRDKVIYPDAFVVQAGASRPVSQSGGTAVLEPPPRARVEPLEVDISEQITRNEYFVEIRDAKDRKVVTVIETLSPDNKRRGSDAFKKYARKRETVLKSDATLVEVDLLRGGEPMRHGPETAGDSRVFVSTPWTRPRARVWPIGLMTPLPVIPIPLREDEEPVDLDLQDIVSTIYETASYEQTLDYTEQLRPPLPPTVRAWLTGRL